MLSYFNQNGRIRPFILALIIIVLGLLLDRTWWQVGLVIIIGLLIHNYYLYTRNTRI